jgi:hypothetical protein
MTISDEYIHIKRVSVNCSLVGYTLWTFISDSLEGSNTYLLNATDSVCIIEYDSTGSEYSKSIYIVGSTYFSSY